MSRSLIITRDELSLADLQLWNPPTLLLPEGGFGPGAQVLNRQTIASPFRHGRTLVGWTFGMQQGTVQVTCRGTSGGTLRTLVGSVLDAFTQWSYTLTFDYDGLQGSWTCEAADYNVGPQGVLDEFDLSFYEQTVFLQVPHHPVPVTGVI